MIRALAIDLDGTLTDEKRRLDLEAVARLREVEEQGVSVTLATGNVLCLAYAASIFVGATGPLIAENGGIVMNPATSETRYSGNIAVVQESFHHLEKKLKVTKVKLSDLRKTEVAIQRDIDVEKVRSILKEFPVSVVDTKFAIHIKDPSVNKGSGLEIVSEMTSIRLDEFVAIGDSENDREMIEAAGFGISVGEPSLKDVCDYITRGRYGEGGKEALDVALRMIRTDRPNK